MDTTLQHYQFINQLAALPFVEKIILFGSRARGDNMPRADIDLAIVCPRADAKDWQQVLDIIDDADTLLDIDCIQYDTLAKDSDLKKRIDEEGQVLYVRQ